MRELNNLFVQNNELLETLQRQIYSSSITCLEDYLSTTLIKKILNNDSFFKNFVKTNPKIINRKFSLNEIYEQLNRIRDIVKFELVNVIYHDLPKVKLMYQSSLEITFPEIDDLVLIIQKRHDMVHRNGKDKEGNKIEISKEIVDNIIDMVQYFIMDLESRIGPLSNDIQEIIDN